MVFRSTSASRRGERWQLRVVSVCVLLWVIQSIFAFVRDLIVFTLLWSTVWSYSLLVFSAACLLFRRASLEGIAVDFPEKFPELTGIFYFNATGWFCVRGLHVFVCTWVRMWMPEDGLRCHSSDTVTFCFVLRHVLTDPGLGEKARVAGQWAQGICPFLPPHWWN